MKNILIQQLMQVLMLVLSPEVFKKLIDTVLDIVEAAVEDSETAVDNMLVLPLCNTIRTAFNVPDDDLPPISVDPRNTPVLNKIPLE